LIIDVISDFDFPSGDKLLQNTKPIVEKIAALRRKADEAEIPVIYVNDNFGKWQSDFKKLLKHASAKTSKGHTVANRLKPRDKDYFVLKPKHSGFYSTTLDLLLQYLGTKTLILTGLTADICVLFTANDAYLRDFKIAVPRDCVASAEPEDLEKALKYIERVLDADTRPSDEIQFAKSGAAK
jgi:nicotinamidase-related amidase